MQNNTPFIVSGRFLFDDRDTSKTVYANSQAQAKELFENAIKVDREHEEGPSTVLINSISEIV